MFGSKKKDEKGSEDEFDPKALLEGIGAMGKALEAMQKEMPKQIAMGVAQAVKAAMPAPAPDEGDPEPPRPEISGEDLEKMDRVNFMKHIVGEVVGAMKKEIGEPLKKEVGDVKANSEKDRLMREISEAKASYSDFAHWGKDIYGLIKQNSGLSVDDAYHLARARDTEKTLKIDEEIKAKMEEEEKAKDGGEEDEDRAILSLFPGSGVSDASEEEEPAVDAKEAANRAWDKTGMDDYKSMFEGAA